MHSAIGGTTEGGTRIDVRDKELRLEYNPVSHATQVESGNDRVAELERELRQLQSRKYEEIAERDTNGLRALEANLATIAQEEDQYATAMLQELQKLQEMSKNVSDGLTEALKLDNEAVRELAQIQQGIKKNATHAGNLAADAKQHREQTAVNTRETFVNATA